MYAGSEKWENYFWTASNVPASSKEGKCDSEEGREGLNDEKLLHKRSSN